MNRHQSRGISFALHCLECKLMNQKHLAPFSFWFSNKAPVIKLCNEWMFSSSLKVYEEHISSKGIWQIKHINQRKTIVRTASRLPSPDGQETIRQTLSRSKRCLSMTLSDIQYITFDAADALDVSRLMNNRNVVARVFRFINHIYFLDFGVKHVELAFKLFDAASCTCSSSAVILP